MEQAMLLDGKVAIVTGAGRGLGRGAARALAANGAAVAVIELDEEKARSACTELRESGARAMYKVCDVRDRSDVLAATAAVIEEFGRIDILVNNAQASFAGQIPFEVYDDDNFSLCHRTGLMGTVYFMQACFPHMKAQGGSIINFASSAGAEGHPGLLGYAATKEGIRGATRVAAREWGKYNIRVNAILPFGMTESTEIYAKEQPEQFRSQLAKVFLGRAGDPREDVGNAIVALSSDLMRYVTGASIPVDGGMCIMS